MANSVEQIPTGFDQRAHAPVGVKTSAHSSVSSGNGLPEIAPEADNKSPLGRVNSTELNKESKLELQDAVSRIQDYVQDTRRTLEFKLDEETGITVISVFDALTNELIRQIPSEEAVSLAQKLNQEEPLSLFRAQV